MSHNEPGAWARLELPGCELGHPYLRDFCKGYSFFSLNVIIYPPSPVTSKHGGFQTFSCPVLKGFPPFPSTVPHWEHVTALREISLNTVEYLRRQGAHQGA